MPLVSAIVPAYNAEAFIGRTLNSILTQTYQNIEVLVVDDGSQDRTGEIVESFAQQDSRVILLKQPNAGVAAARNLAVENSKGEYIAPIDADDIWYSQKIEKQVQCMVESEKSVGLVYAWSLNIDENDVVISSYDNEENLDFKSLEGNVYTALVYTNFIGNASSPLIRRVCFEKLGGYTRKFKEHNAQGCEDWELYLRIAECYQFRVVRDFLVGYRQISRSMSSDYKSMAKSYNLCMASFLKRHPEIPSYVYSLSASSFYIYLSNKSTACADNWSTLFFLYKSIKLDFVLLKEQWIYKRITKCILKIIFNPLISFILSDKANPLLLNTRKILLHRLIKNRVITVRSIQQVNQNKWDKYGKTRWQRWLDIVQLCRISSSRN
ncbi:glycosyltransferase family 2 protein [aff. Roholtiella sp. LEGE 12411]|uniref:glycosyltransferase family 2 protein n=1 Tax=aff. Roholtiella sp. LEGE 12411 TaxID=1828822 RepID=UPI001882B922|nr:glycosyltransferase family 2 protein [aff. Roholtiella sp. LEGE 12411]MBE9034289.1 glycosyltransferase family 2 protein [aff. Roholtiella sp. LEGE 12411]